MRRVMLVVALGVAGGAWAQVDRVTVMPFPLELEPHPSLKKDEAALVDAFEKKLGEAQAVVPTRPERAAVLAEVKRADCAESDECLKAIAEKSGSLYGLFAVVGYEPKPGGAVVTLRGRVVRKDGKVMGSAVVEQPKEQRSVVEAFSLAAGRFFDELKVRGLPGSLEVAAKPDVAPVVVPAITTPVVAPAVPQGPSGLAVAGWVGAGVGVAAAVAGAVVFATAGTVQRDANGNVALADAPRVAGIEGQHTAGVALVGGGAGLAVLGVVLGIVGGNGASAPRAGVAVSTHGAVVSVGGSF